jgi:hypothetical protein
MIYLGSTQKYLEMDPNATILFLPLKNLQKEKNILFSCPRESFDINCSEP